MLNLGENLMYKYTALDGSELGIVFAKDRMSARVKVLKSGLKKKFKLDFICGPQVCSDIICLDLK